MSDIHYSEGEFPDNMYGASYEYGTGFPYGPFTPEQWGSSRCKCKCKDAADLFITDVSVQVTRSIKMTISFSDGTKNDTTIEIGKKYVVKYIENGQLVQVVGVITAIGDTGTNVSPNCPCCTTDYILQIDCSTANQSSIITVRTSMIRSIVEYTGNEGVDPDIKVSTTYGATAFGSYDSVVLQDATIDSDGNVTKGTVISATMVKDASAAIGGCSTGLNKTNTKVTVYDAVTKDGKLTGGKVISARMYSPIVTGGTAKDGLLEGATVKANEAKMVVIDAEVYNGNTTDGKLINPVFEDSIVTGGTRYGDDMVTYGATVFGLTAYGGATSGGILYGGTAIGTIDGMQFTIENGETTGGNSMKGILSGGKVVGGAIIGDTTVGSVIYNGTLTKATTVGGKTTLGTNGVIKPGFGTIPAGLANPVNNYSQFFEKDVDELIIWWKYGRVESNLGEYKGPKIPYVNKK